MAWKGTRPPAVTSRDEKIYEYLKEHGKQSRNQIAEAIGLSKSLTYLSLDRLRKTGRAKRCMAEDSNDLLWTVAVEEPCP
jgi:predicted ArsR family transcriptional regulator